MQPAAGYQPYGQTQYQPEPAYAGGGPPPPMYAGALQQQPAVPVGVPGPPQYSNQGGVLQMPGVAPAPGQYPLGSPMMQQQPEQQPAYITCQPGQYQLDFLPPSFRVENGVIVSEARRTVLLVVLLSMALLFAALGVLIVSGTIGLAKKASDTALIGALFFIAPLVMILVLCLSKEFRCEFHDQARVVSVFQRRLILKFCSQGERFQIPYDDFLTIEFESTGSTQSRTYAGGTGLLGERRGYARGKQQWEAKARLRDGSVQTVGMFSSTFFDKNFVQGFAGFFTVRMPQVRVIAPPMWQDFVALGN